MNDQKPAILIIDDTPANLLTLGVALESDFELQIATSGAMGLALAALAPPDLILLDIMMPEMDGFETCRRLKSNQMLKDIPVVFVSALMETESEANGLALGAVDYITKPVNVEIARQRIRNLLDREVLRKNALTQNDRLAESEAFKLAILNSLTEEIVVLDHAGVILAINDSWRRFAQSNLTVSGKLAECVGVGSNYLDVCRKAISADASDVATASEALCGIQAVLDGTLPGFSMQYPCHSPIQERWFTMVVAPFQRSNHGGVVISHIDISENKVMHAKLVDSEAHLRAIILNEPECIKVVDAQGLLVQMNPAGLAMIEADSLEQVSGRSVLDLIAPEHRPAFLDLHKKVLAGNPAELEFEVLGLKGGRRWLETHAVPLQEHGATVQLAVTRDITSRKAAEGALKQQLRFGEALNQVAQAIIQAVDSSSVLQDTCNTVGRALDLDRVLIYKVSFREQQASRLSEWLNPRWPELERCVGTYPMEMFMSGATELLRSKKHLTSQIDQVNPILLADGSGQLLHQQMRIQSLLWYPFDFQSDSFNVLALNQVYSSKRWTLRELDFLDAISRQLSIGLTKVGLMEAQRQTQDKLQLAASVFTYAREGILITNVTGEIIEVNEAFTLITGYTRAEVMGKNPRLLNSGRQGCEFYVNMWHQLNDRGHWNGEIWNRRKSGELFAEMLTISAVFDSQGKVEHFVGLFTDITAFKSHEEELDHRAHYDALTDLPNRLLLADRLRQGMVQAQRRGKLLAVVYLDLDGFKDINDTHGHAGGDQLLITLANRMKQTLREGDTLARVGGDEFVAVLIDLDDALACQPMLARLLDAAAESTQFGNVRLQVSASMGVTFYPQTGDLDAEQLLRQADQAMYQAKVAGKNRCCVFETPPTGQIAEAS